MTNRGYVLSYPDLRFNTGFIAVFAEMQGVGAGSTIWFVLVGPDGEEVDVSSGELVPQNMLYIQSSHALGGLELARGPYRAQVFVDNILLGEKDVMLGGNK